MSKPSSLFMRKKTGYWCGRVFAFILMPVILLQTSSEGEFTNKKKPGDTPSGVKIKKLKVSLHPYVLSFCDTDARTIIQHANALLVDDDGPGNLGTQDDVAVNIKWVLYDNRLYDFTEKRDYSYHIIETAGEADEVLTHEMSGNVLIVEEITFAVAHTIVGGRALLPEYLDVVHYNHDLPLAQSSVDGVILAHEYGHMAGIGFHRNDTDAVMNNVDVSPACKEINSTEAQYFWNGPTR